MWFALGFLEAFECGKIVMEGLSPPSVAKSPPERFLERGEDSLFRAEPLVHRGYLGTPGRTRTSSLRIRSPSRHNPLTEGYTQEPRHSKGFECSTVCSTLH